MSAQNDPAQAEAIRALDAPALRDRIASGSLSVRQVAEAYLARITDRAEPSAAWAWLDPDFIRQQAEALDRHRAAGHPLGPLHGLPIALQDVIDMARAPSENGTERDQGRVPMADATIVERLKAGGALLMGKATTTPLGVASPGAQSLPNPVDPSRSAGGPCGGAAAVVAEAMSIASIAMQTEGEISFAASACGLAGFKPTPGSLSRNGIARVSQSLDAPGVLARSPATAALVAEQLYGRDEADPATTSQPFPRLSQIMAATGYPKPVFAVVLPPTPQDGLSAQLREAFTELTAVLGERAFAAPLPDLFAQASEQVERVRLAELSRNGHVYVQEPGLADLLAAGDQILARDYLAAMDWKSVLNGGLAELFRRANVILCPAAVGPADLRETDQGDDASSRALNSLWSLCGLPSVTLPLLTSAEGLPMGVQLVANHGEDGRLLRAADWLLNWVNAASAE
ncbi:MAG: amidase [Rhodospirillaceae bacterium]